MGVADHTNLVLSCSFYLVSSAGMSVFNKLAVNALPLPITLVIIQMAFTVGVLALSWKTVRVGSWRDALRWGLTVPFLFSAMLVSSMFAFEHNTLGTVVVCRNIAPMFTLMIERMFRVPITVTTETILALLTILLGVVLYHFNTLSLTLIGFVAIALNMVFAVLERLLQRHLMAQDPVDLSKPAMMLLNNSFGLLPNALLLAMYGETGRWADAFGALSQHGQLMIVLSCLNGVAISYAGLRVQQLVTATTFMVLTNVNKFLVIIFGVMVLKDELTALGTVGVGLAMGGGLWYAQARKRSSEAEAEAAGARKEEEKGVLLEKMESGGVTRGSPAGARAR